MRAHRRFLLVPLGLALGALLLLGTPPAVADDLDDEIEARVHRIEELEKEVRALRGMREAEKHAEPERQVEEAAREGVGLFLRILKAALEDDAEGVEEVVEGINELAERLENGTAGKRHAERRERLAKKHLEHATNMLRAARKAFAEIENEDLVEVMERAVHVHELLIEGATDEAHRLIEEHKLTWERMRELLVKASKLYDGWGHEGTAKALRDLASRGHGERGHPKREGRMQHGEALERIEAMQEKVEMVMGVAHALREELEELKRAMK